jgi:23S rRNA pseudouridine1911/1915/1917 synthase
METFTSRPGSEHIGKVFHFRFEGEACRLKPYLVERYRYGRSAAWRETFYPERVRLNGETVGEDTLVCPGDTVTYWHLRAEEPPHPSPLRVLYEDEWVLAIHKPDDAPVSPSGLYYFTSLALRARECFAAPELTPVHRLDLETSGVLLFAKRKAYLARWNAMFSAQRITKRYTALVEGHFPERVTRVAGRMGPHPASRIETKLWLDPAGPANSDTRVVQRANHGELTELLLEPITGKTNQIRVHLAHAGHPIVGDKKYHPDEDVFLDWLVHRDYVRLDAKLRLPRHALQCQSLAFDHPFTGQSLKIEALAGSWGEKIGTLISKPAFD